MDQPESSGDCRGRKDADQNRPANPKSQKHQHDEKTQNAHQRDRMPEIAEAHQRSRSGDHQAAVLESNQRDEQADSCGNPAFQRLRNGVHNLGANAGQCNRHKENPRQQHRRQRLLPGQTKPQGRHAAERVHKEEVLAHARRKGHRIIGDQAHEQRGKRPGQAGGRQDGAKIHSGLRKHSRLDEDDVRHRQKSGDAANHLALQGGAVGFKLEECE